MSRNDDYATGIFLNFWYHQNYYELSGIDLSWQTSMNIPQNINFVQKLEDDDATIFLLLKSNKKKF